MQQSPALEQGSYTDSLTRERHGKNQFFIADTRSPLPPNARHNLDYFVPDVNYRLTAKLSRFTEVESVQLSTSSGQPRTMLRYGRLDFVVTGEPASLVVYRAVDKPDVHCMFVPFRDATSGIQTYGAGRYLDVPEQRGVEQLIDFNLAYNPFCAYSIRFVCPLPPRDNWLTLSILAGERTFRRTAE